MLLTALQSTLIPQMRKKLEEAHPAHPGLLLFQPGLCYLHRHALQTFCQEPFVVLGRAGPTSHTSLPSPPLPSHTSLSSSFTPAFPAWHIFNQSFFLHLPSPSCLWLLGNHSGHPILSLAVLFGNCSTNSEHWVFEALIKCHVFYVYSLYYLPIIIPVLLVILPYFLFLFYL